MSSLQDLFGQVSSYYNRMDKAKIRDSTELSSSFMPTNQTGGLLNATQKKKDITQIKGMIGNLQRSDLGVRLNTIESDFYKAAIAGYDAELVARQNTRQEGQILLSYQQQAIANHYSLNKPRSFKGSGDKYRRIRQDYVSAFGSPQTLMAYYQDVLAHPNADPERTLLYYGGLRDSLRDENSLTSRLYHTAESMNRAQQITNSKIAKRAEAQQALIGAEATALANAETLRINLDLQRDRTVNTLEDDLRDRTLGTNTIALLTETNKGAAKPTISLPKDKTKQVTQPSLYANRPQ